MTRSLRVLLAASLLVNVFAAGAIGGGAFMLSRPGGFRVLAGMRQRPIREAGQELSQPDREHFRQTMRDVLRGNVDLVRTARESRRAAAQLFIQPQFDQTAEKRALLAEGLGRGGPLRHPPQIGETSGRTP